MTFDTPAGFRSGFATFVGRPNVGKSTLVNGIVGQKVSIVSARPQTTRTEVRGVLDRPGSQVVVLDTPGLHRPKTLLGERQNARAAEAVRGVDLACLVLDATASMGPGDRFVAALMARGGIPGLAIVNKIDLADEAVVSGRIKEASVLSGVEAVFAVSALTGDGVGTLVEGIVSRLPEGPRYYPEGTVTDQPETFLAAEIVREKLLAVVREELPHSIAVSVDEFEERLDGTLAMRAVVRVERDSQKGIVIGHRGQVLRDVGIAARLELEELLGTKVYLETFVKVDPAWPRRAKALDKLGY